MKAFLAAMAARRRLKTGVAQPERYKDDDSDSLESEQIPDVDAFDNAETDFEGDPADVMMDEASMLTGIMKKLRMQRR